jgi:hypothetical protein
MVVFELSVSQSITESQGEEKHQSIWKSEGWDKQSHNAIQKSRAVWHGILIKVILNYQNEFVFLKQDRNCVLR